MVKEMGRTKRIETDVRKAAKTSESPTTRSASAAWASALPTPPKPKNTSLPVPLETPWDSRLKDTWSDMDERLKPATSKRELQLFRAGLWTASLPMEVVWSCGEKKDNRELCTRLSRILNEIEGPVLEIQKSALQCVERLRSILEDRFYCEFAGRFVRAAGYREYFRTIYTWLHSTEGKEWFRLGIEIGLLQSVSWIVFEQQCRRLNISGATGPDGYFQACGTVTVIWFGTLGNIATVSVDFSHLCGPKKVRAAFRSGSWVATFKMPTQPVGHSGKEVLLVATDKGGEKLTITETIWCQSDADDPDPSIAIIGPAELEKCLRRSITSCKPTRADPTSAKHLEYWISIANLLEAAAALPDQRLRLLPCLTILQQSCPDAEEAQLRRLG